ncbi:MAG: hypothetical protein LBN32_01070 [Helicobacteraceae bacterium]|jgi:hypothetical protein|nr:hypothetical protein [Helicobacteraceae bacterium]
MKKIILLLLCAIALRAEAALEGQRVYNQMLRANTAINGADLAKQHSGDEWQKLFEEEGDAFATEISAQYPAASKYLHSAQFRRQREALLAFFVRYANDSNSTPLSD